jgi:hypothetical protein
MVWWKFPALVAGLPLNRCQMTGDMRLVAYCTWKPPALVGQNQRHRHPLRKLGDIARRFGAQMDFTPSHPISCLIICPAFSGPMSTTS